MRSRCSWRRRCSRPCPSRRPVGSGRGDPLVPPPDPGREGGHRSPTSATWPSSCPGWAQTSTATSCCGPRSRRRAVRRRAGVPARAGAGACGARRERAGGGAAGRPDGGAPRAVCRATQPASPTCVRSFCVAGGQACSTTPRGSSSPSARRGPVSAGTAPARRGERRGGAPAGGPPTSELPPLVPVGGRRAAAEAAREARRTGMGLGLCRPADGSRGGVGQRGLVAGRRPSGGPGGHARRARSGHGGVGEAAAVVADGGARPRLRPADPAARAAPDTPADCCSRGRRSGFASGVRKGCLPPGGTWVDQDNEALLAAVGIAAHRHWQVVLDGMHGLADRRRSGSSGRGCCRWSDGSAGADAARGRPGARPLRWVDVSRLANGWR